MPVSYFLGEILSLVGLAVCRKSLCMFCMCMTLCLWSEDAVLPVVWLPGVPSIQSSTQHLRAGNRRKKPSFPNFIFPRAQWCWRQHHLVSSQLRGEVQGPKRRRHGSQSEQAQLPVHRQSSSLLARAAQAGSSASANLNLSSCSLNQFPGQPDALFSKATWVAIISESGYYRQASWMTAF